MAKNLVFAEGRRLNLPVGAGVKSGDPVAIGAMTGVALNDRDAAGNATVDFGGVYELSVKAVSDVGNSAVAVGDQLYFVVGDTPKLSKKSSTGLYFGFALDAVGSGETATIRVANVAAPGPGTPNILAAAVGTTELGDGVVTNVKLDGGFLKAALIAGGAAGDHTVTGIAAGDELVAVLQIDIDTGAVVDVDDLTAEFTIKAADTIENDGGTATTGDKLLVLYLDLTA